MARVAKNKTKIGQSVDVAEKLRIQEQTTDHGNV